MRLLNLGLTTILAASIGIASCGDSKRNPSAAPGEAGQPAVAGAGGSQDLPDPVRCGSALCRPIVLPGADPVATCCVDPTEGICGAEVSTLLPGMGCVPLTQPGEIDRSCPASPAGAAGLPLPPLPGCCNPNTQQCGYMVGDFGGLLPFAPGCVDSALLVPDEEPRACGDVGGGGGGPGDGTGGAAGASMSSGGAGTGSGGADPTPGGAGGIDSGSAGAGGADMVTGGAGGALAEAGGGGI
jgi:hypothetical protein